MQSIWKRLRSTLLQSKERQKTIRSMATIGLGVLLLGGCDGGTIVYEPTTSAVSSSVIEKSSSSAFFSSPQMSSSASEVYSSEYASVAYSSEASSVYAGTSSSADVMKLTPQATYETHCTVCHGENGQSGIATIDPNRFGVSELTTYIEDNMALLSPESCVGECAELTALYIKSWTNSSNNGEELYNALACVACHGVEGEGGIFPFNIEEYDVRELVSYIDLEMPFGGPDQCTGQCANDVAVYIKSWKAYGDTKRGEQLYSELQCSTCHGSDGTGPIAAIDASQWNNTDLAFYIEANMPFSQPWLCVGSCAQDIAAFIKTWEPSSSSSSVNSSSSVMPVPQSSSSVAFVSSSQEQSQSTSSAVAISSYHVVGDYDNGSIIWQTHNCEACHTVNNMRAGYIDIKPMEWQYHELQPAVQQHISLPGTVACDHNCSTDVTTFMYFVAEERASSSAAMSSSSSSVAESGSSASSSSSSSSYGSSSSFSESSSSSTVSSYDSSSSFSEASSSSIEYSSSSSVESSSSIVVSSSSSQSAIPSGAFNLPVSTTLIDSVVDVTRNKLYFTGGSLSVNALDLKTGLTESIYATRGLPNDLELSPSGDFLYILYGESGPTAAIVTVDLDSGESFYHSLDFSATNLVASEQHIFVMGNNGNTFISVIDRDSMKEVTRTATTGLRKLNFQPLTQKLFALFDIADTYSSGIEEFAWLGGKLKWLGRHGLADDTASYWVSDDQDLLVTSQDEYLTRGIYFAESITHDYGIHSVAFNPNNNHIAILDGAQFVANYHGYLPEKTDVLGFYPTAIELFSTTEGLYTINHEVKTNQYWVELIKADKKELPFAAEQTSKANTQWLTFELPLNFDHYQDDFQNLTLSFDFVTPEVFFDHPVVVEPMCGAVNCGGYKFFVEPGVERTHVTVRVANFYVGNDPSLLTHIQIRTSDPKALVYGVENAIWRNDLNEMCQGAPEFVTGHVASDSIILDMEETAGDIIVESFSSSSHSSSSVPVYGSIASEGAYSSEATRNDIEDTIKEQPNYEQLLPEHKISTICAYN